MATYFLTLLEAGSPRSRCWQGWFPLRPLSLICKWLSLSVLSHVLPLCEGIPGVFPCVLNSFYKDPSQIRLVHTPLFYLNHPFKGPDSKYIHIEVLELRASTYEFWRSNSVPYKQNIAHCHSVWWVHVLQRRSRF